MRRLVVCCDGTWNSWDNMDGGLRAPTNVVKFYSEVADYDANGTEQITYYRTGVGTLGNKFKKLIDGAFGTNLENDIQSAYKFLAENYQNGDEIYIVGFSRGAFSARSLAGVVGSIGLCDLTDPEMADRKKWDDAKAAVLRYKLNKLKKTGWKAKSLIRERNAGKDRIASYLRPPGSVPIKFLGVWDTVGALGVPKDYALMRRLIGDRRANRFLDTTLGANVEVARHALALDERRVDFTPTLWTAVEPGRDVEQVWFAGVHGDVGGSYANHELGDITLKWMMEAAHAHGLTFRDGATAQLSPNPQGRQHDSFRGVFKRRMTRPRKVPCFDIGHDELTRLHDSAVDRHERPPLGTDHYWFTKRLEITGQSLKTRVQARQRWAHTGLYVKGGERYQVRAVGAWRDAGIDGDADGANRQVGLGYGLAVVPELFRDVMRNDFGDKASDNRFSRRAPGKWFELIGVVANGQGVSPGEQNIEMHEMFTLGSDGKLVAKRDGYVYCFANDAWMAYGNNSGTLTVTFTRQ